MTEPTDKEQPEREALQEELAENLPEEQVPETEETALSEEEAPAELEQVEPEQAEPEQAEPEPPAEKPAKRGGGFLVWLVLLIALAGCGGVGYLYWELIHKDPQGDLKAELASASEQSSAAVISLQDDLDGELSALRASQESALAEALASFDSRMEAAEAGFASSLSDVINTAPPSEREWKLAEAAYLLRVANHRLLMEQDARTALTMLEATDQILTELDDFSLHTVRAALADEMLALRRVRGADVQGLYLTIEAIKNQLAGLPIAVPEYIAEVPEAPEPPPEADFWEVLRDRFFALFSFREVGRDGVRPLLAPDETLYLEQNIRLTLEQAQLAALKRHQAVYEASLTNARAWVEAYLAGDSQDVQDFVTELNELLAVDLERPMPDISASFTALNDVLRGTAPVEPAPPAEEETLPEGVQE